MARAVSMHDVSVGCMHRNGSTTSIGEDMQHSLLLAPSVSKILQEGGYRADTIRAEGTGLEQQPIHSSCAHGRHQIFHYFGHVATWGCAQSPRSSHHAHRLHTLDALLERSSISHVALDDAEVAVVSDLCLQ